MNVILALLSLTLAHAAPLTLEWDHAPISDSFRVERFNFVTGKYDVIGGDEDTPAVGDGQWWVLFRDLPGIPVPEGGEAFIHWSSTSGEPRPIDDPETPAAFWA